jgi:hypothetical protein
MRIAMGIGGDAIGTAIPPLEIVKQARRSGRLSRGVDDALLPRRRCAERPCRSRCSDKSGGAWSGDRAHLPAPPPGPGSAGGHGTGPLRRPADPRGGSVPPPGDRRLARDPLRQSCRAPAGIHLRARTAAPRRQRDSSGFRALPVAVCDDADLGRSAANPSAAGQPEPADLRSTGRRACGARRAAGTAG